MNIISIDELKRLFRLNPETGKLFWRISVGTSKAGSRAGYLKPNGYRQIGFNGKYYQEHRIVFAMVYGRWPESEIDHRNLNKADNRPNNLREATRAKNNSNVGRKSNNTSGVKGVYFNKRHGKWYARITCDRERIHLGFYDDLETAGYAYLSASLKYHGEFGRAA